MMIDHNAQVLLSRLGPVRRARGHRLYRADGQRFLDLWQVGGRAVLGHNPPGVLLGLKNTADQGLLAPFPHPVQGKLSKAIGRLPGLEGRAVTLYADPPSADRALASAALDLSLFADPAFDSVPADCRAALWRPFLGDSPSGASLPPILAPVLPLPLGNGPVALACAPGTTLPPGDFFSPVIAQAALRSVELLLRVWDARSTPLEIPRIQKGLDLPDSPWLRRGSYLTLKAAPSPGQWEELFGFFIEGGVLLPPDASEPVILPAELSQGEETRLAELLEIPRNWA